MKACRHIVQSCLPTVTYELAQVQVWLCEIQGLPAQAWDDVILAGLQALEATPQDVPVRVPVLVGHVLHALRLHLLGCLHAVRR